MAYELNDGLDAANIIVKAVGLAHRMTPGIEHFMIEAGNTSEDVAVVQAWLVFSYVVQSKAEGVTEDGRTEDGGADL